MSRVRQLIDAVELEAKGLKATVDWELGGPYPRVEIWAPFGKYFCESGTHVLCSQVNREELKDLIKRMLGGTSDCKDGGCNGDCENHVLTVLED
jgi:hypothetical protein